MGFAVGAKTVRGLGLVSVASPLPFVFSAHGGLETFAQTFAVTLHTADGKQQRIEVDVARYSQFGGAYNGRRMHEDTSAFLAWLS